VKTQNLTASNVDYNLYGQDGISTIVMNLQNFDSCSSAVPLRYYSLTNISLTVMTPPASHSGNTDLFFLIV